ncbi:MAG: MBL fold metallo-hydrolase [Anaerolineae bacterium]|nr:MBL fold metallo-hydrolase [Anaerolineae bacterium]
MIDNIQWLGHGSFVIQSDPLIYINPWRITRKVFHPDAILIGHEHHQHFSIPDIEKLRGADTKIIGNTMIANQLPETTILRHWNSISISKASIKAVPAYSPNHPKHALDAGGLGFVISLNFYDIYYAGDTQTIPEMSRIHPDIAILPIDGDGTLTVEEAAEVVHTMRPRWVIPSNWGYPSEGATLIDAQRFKRLVGDSATVIIPEQIR